MLRSSQNFPIDNIENCVLTSAVIFPTPQTNVYKLRTSVRPSIVHPAPPPPPSHSTACNTERPATSFIGTLTRSPSPSFWCWRGKGRGDQSRRTCAQWVRCELALAGRRVFFVGGRGGGGGPRRRCTEKIQGQKKNNGAVELCGAVWSWRTRARRDFLRISSTSTSTSTHTHTPAHPHPRDSGQHTNVK